MRPYTHVSAPEIGPASSAAALHPARAARRPLCNESASSARPCIQHALPAVRSAMSMHQARGPASGTRGPVSSALLTSSAHGPASSARCPAWSARGPASSALCPASSGIQPARARECVLLLAVCVSVCTSLTGLWKIQVSSCNYILLFLDGQLNAINNEKTDLWIV